MEDSETLHGSLSSLLCLAPFRMSTSIKCGIQLAISVVDHSKLIVATVTPLRS